MSSHRSYSRRQLRRDALHVTVSGPFRRAIDDVHSAVRELADLGATVLSPADPRIVAQFGDFVFVASDRVRHIRTVQERHLAAISASDFLWLVAPDGYIGSSASMEIGWAARDGVPIFCRDVPVDLTMRAWVTVVPTMSAAIRVVTAQRSAARRKAPADAVLLDPERGLQAIHDDLVVAQQGLLGTPAEQQTAAANAALDRTRERLLVP